MVVVLTFVGFWSFIACSSPIVSSG